MREIWNYHPTLRIVENKTLKKGIQTPRNSKNCRAKVTHCIPNKTFIIWKSPVRKVKIYANLDCLTKTILTEKTPQKIEKKKAKSPGINRLLIPPFSRQLFFAALISSYTTFLRFFLFCNFRFTGFFNFQTLKPMRFFVKRYIVNIIFCLQCSRRWRKKRRKSFFFLSSNLKRNNKNEKLFPLKS